MSWLLWNLSNFNAILSAKKITPSKIHFYNNFEDYIVGDIPIVDDKSKKAVSTPNYYTIDGIKSLVAVDSLENIPAYCRNNYEIQEDISPITGKEEKKLFIRCKSSPNDLFPSTSTKQNGQQNTLLEPVDRVCSIEELISYIISYLRVSAIQYLKKKPMKRRNMDTNKLEKQSISLEINKVVLGIPATFPEKKKEILKYAANLAGFEEVKNSLSFF